MDTGSNKLKLRVGGVRGAEGDDAESPMDGHTAWTQTVGKQSLTSMAEDRKKKMK